MRCLIENTNVFKMSGMSKKLSDFFQRKVSETTFLISEDGDFQIHLSEEQTNRYSIDQTCVTHSRIPGEPSSKVTLDSQPFHRASSFQFTKKKCCKLTGFKSFPGCIMTLSWLGCLVRKESLKSVPEKNLGKYL